MGLLERVSQQMAADIDLLLGQVDDPELTIFQLICDMEESIVDLRRETVATVARQNRLRKRLFAAEETARDVERQASLALQAGKERRARQVIGSRIGALKERDALEVELSEASGRAARLVAALIRMEDRAQVARRKKDDLVRRRRARETDRRPEIAAATRDAGAFAAYTDAVTALGLEAEATHEPQVDRPGRIRRTDGRTVEGGEGC